MQKKILKVMMCAITTMTLSAGCGNSNTEKHNRLHRWDCGRQHRG